MDGGGRGDEIAANLPPSQCEKQAKKGVLAPARPHPDVHQQVPKASGPPSRVGQVCEWEVAWVAGPGAGGGGPPPGPVRGMVSAAL